MATKTVNAVHITEELKAIRKDLEFIKSHMFDPDTIMTTEEERRFKQALQELKNLFPPFCERWHKVLVV